MTERFVPVDGAELCAETFGDPADPPIVLVMGAGGSMDWWDPEFCALLAGRSRRVVRFDLRDTGRSVTHREYSGDDLVADVAGLVTGLGLGRAHIVGVSMGGAIAQVVALDHPERVAGLTLISTSPGPGDDDLPPSTPEMRAYFAQAKDPDWADRAAVIEHMVAYQRALGLSDEAALRATAGRAFDRTADFEASMTKHYAIEGSGPWRDRLGTIGVPTLVIHGTEDPLFPYEHGIALAHEIPGARLLPMPGVGHEVPPRRMWDLVIPAIAEHTATR
ncbi:alpha/beta hydrolase [Streptosporangiaceae bacterium NEAU-GS5]|nr:alpha/beta hydrolase [Streptosporangiaceae bacterium NEAU-GS5]